MKPNSKVSNKANENLESISISRTRSLIHRPTLPKLRSVSNHNLNTSNASNTTESSILRCHDSFSISGKPPRVPILKTGQVRQKEKSEIFNEVDDKFYYKEFR